MIKPTFATTFKPGLHCDPGQRSSGDAVQGRKVCPINSYLRGNSALQGSTAAIQACAT